MAKKQNKNNPEYQPNIEITKFLENHDDYLSIPEGWALDIHHTQKHKIEGNLTQKLSPPICS